MFTSQVSVARPITATGIVRVSRSGTPTIVLEGDDKGLYLVQLANGGQTPKDMTNAWVSGVLARSVGLPMTVQICIAVESQAMREEIICATKLDGKGNVPDHGIFLANRLTGTDSGALRTFSYLPQAYLNTVVNRADFLGMYLFDLWAQRQEARRALYHRTGRGRELRATFINDLDQSSVTHLRLESWNGPTCNEARTLYEELWTSKAVLGWTDKFSTILPKAIEVAIASLPVIWQTDYTEQLGSSLQGRVKLLSAFLHVHTCPMGRPSREAHLDRSESFLPGFLIS